jgi:predicted nucleic acid-binding protein
VVVGTSGCIAGTIATSITTWRFPIATYRRDRLPEHESAIVLARLEHLDLLGDPADVRLTRAVHDEIGDKPDEVAARVAELAAAVPPIVDDIRSEMVDPTRVLGRGERSVLNYALATGPDVLCVLDDAAARAEARRLEVSFTGRKSRPGSPRCVARSPALGRCGRAD